MSRADDGRLTTIDLMIVTPVFERAWASRVSATWRGKTIACVSLAGLAEMKRLAARPQDLADLEALGVATEPPA